jgi:hypothetical protein
MARGTKSKRTSKQRRQAHHSEESASSPQRAAKIGYATTNKQDKGGKKTGGVRGKSRTTASGRKGGRRRGRK